MSYLKLFSLNQIEEVPEYFKTPKENSIVVKKKNRPKV